jgi:hypothetical protein
VLLHDILIFSVFSACQQNIFLMGTPVVSPSIMLAMVEPHFFSTTLKAIQPYLVMVSVHISVMSASCLSFTDKLHA